MSYNIEMSLDETGSGELVEISRNRYYGSCDCGADLAVYIIPFSGEGVPIRSQGVFYIHTEMRREHIYIRILRCTGCHKVVGSGDPFMIEQ